VAKVDPGWSLDAVLREYDPHPSWRRWFTEAYGKAVGSADPEERLAGWKTAAIIFGDMHVPVFCLFACHHGRTLEPPGGKSFQGHVNLCLWELGLAVPEQPNELGPVPVRDVAKPETFRRDLEAEREWMAEQLRPFGGDVGLAAAFAMRLTTIRFGLLRGPAEPSIAQVLDASLWQRVDNAENA
jgi:hypothetical protein